MGSPTLRSPVARARGLGSAPRGSEAWLAERISAIALIPLLLWLVISLVRLHGAAYADFVGWIREPASTLLMVLLLVALFHHTALGVEVIIEDYMHSAARRLVLLGCRVLCVTLCATGLLAILRLDTKPTVSAAQVSPGRGALAAVGAAAGAGRGHPRLSDSSPPPAPDPPGYASHWAA